MVRDVGGRLLLDVEVVDVAQENVLHRLVQEEREKIRTFPTLIAESGQRFQGEMTEEKLESFLSQMVDQNQKKYL